MACRQLFAVYRWTLETLPDSFAITPEGHRNLLISQLIEISVVTPSEKTYSRHHVKMQAPPVRKDAMTVAETRDMDANNHHKENRQVLRSSGEDLDREFRARPSVTSLAISGFSLFPSAPLS
jgi:hypothetical protein